MARQLPFPLPDPFWTGPVVAAIGEQSPQSDDASGIRDAWLNGFMGGAHAQQYDSAVAARVPIVCVAIPEIAPVLVATGSVARTLSVLSEISPVVVVSVEVVA